MITRIRKNPFHTIIFFLLLLNVTLTLINTGLWFTAAHQNLFLAADFTSFYTSFSMVLNGDGAKLYDLSVQAKYQQEIMGNVSFEGGLLPYAYPPFIAIFFSPIALIPIKTAFFVWTVGELGLLIWLIILSNRLFSDWSKQERLVMLIATLAFWPLTHTFLLGQFSLFLLLCCYQMYIAIRKSQMGKAGYWLTLLVIKPQTLLIPGIITLNKRFWRIALSVVISGVSIFILTSLILGIQIWLRYIRELLTLSTYFGKFGFVPDSQYTLRGVLTNIFGYSQPGLINMISITALIAGLLLTWLLWFKGISVNSHRFNLYFAFTIVLSVFFNLYAYPHDNLILVLPVALFYDYLRHNRFILHTYSIFILICPLIFFIAAFSKFNLLGVFRPPVVVILLLLAWIIRYLILDFRTDHSNEQSINSSSNPI